MATSPLSSDIFKFMAIRPTLRSKKQKNDIRYVEDIRIWEDNFACPEDDSEGRALNEQLFELVKTYVCPGINKEVKAKNKELLDALESSLDTRRESLINFPELLDELIEVVTLYSMKPDFNRCALICDVECVIRKYSENKNITLREFVEGSWFAQLNYELFNRLYILYIFKRRHPLNLDYIFSALRTINVLKWLNHDHLIEPCNISIEQVKGCLSILGSFFQKSKNSKQYSKNSPTQFSAKTKCDFEKSEQTVLNSLQDLISAFNATPIIHPIFAYLYFYKCPFNPIKPIGIGDLKIVREKLCKYEAGEIAHIENVLKGESKERNHRRLNRLDDLFTTETERIEENTRDTLTTKRFETKKEIEKIVNEEINVNAEVSGSVSGSYGVVKYNVAASAGFSYGRATTDSNRSTSNYAKDIVDRSVNRVENRVKELRSIRQIIETEEINIHKLDNSKDSKTHISGIYRYVDKRYKSQLYNYGKRLMFEFVIPEPAFWYKSILDKLQSETDDQSLPVEPPKPKLSDVDTNVDKIYEIFPYFNDQLPSVPTLPGDKIDQQLLFGFNSVKENDDGDVNYKVTHSIEVPEKATLVIKEIKGEFTAYGYNAQGRRNAQLKITIDKQSENKFTTGQYTSPTPFSILPNFSISTMKSVGIEIEANGKVKNIINGQIVYDLKFNGQNAVDVWKKETFAKLLAAYNTAYIEYTTKLTTYKNNKTSKKEGLINTIRGRNTKLNEEIVKNELKKHSITIFSKEFDSIADDDEFSSVNPISQRKVSFWEPNFDEGCDPEPMIPHCFNHDAIQLETAMYKGKFVQFFEQAFEWDNLSYLLYPYFWNTENKWKNMLDTYDETDFKFGAFMRAGSARVLIPVHPSYEAAVLHFLYTKEIWNGGEAPAIGDDLYIPIHEEIRSQQDNLNNAIPEGEPWEYVVPTPLVYLQQNSELPTFNC